jgi:nitric oxide reductase NorD protein
VRRRPAIVRRTAALLSRAADVIGGFATPWKRRLGAGRPRTVRLDDVRRRLELLVTAVYDRPIPIVTADRPRTRMSTLWTDPFAARHLQRTEYLATTDGERIRLPSEIVAADPDEALARYRLMAVEQAERILRGTTARLPAAASAMERDLYLVREGEVIDAAIVRSVPGLRGALVAARAEALGARPPLTALTPAERAVEALVRGSLSSDLRTPAGRRDTTAEAGSPDDSLAWARERAKELGDRAGRYRGIAPVAPWGAVEVTSRLPHERLERADELAALKGTKYGVGKFGQGSGKGGRQSSKTGQKAGTAEHAGDDESIHHRDGRRTVLTSGVAETLSDVPEDTSTVDDENAEAHDIERGENDELTHRDSVAPPRRSAGRAPAPKLVAGGIEYPEWDWEAGDYREHGAIVRSHEPDVSDDSWGNTVLARHGALVRRLRERFDRLRARRTRLTQQRDGDELDLTACVRALVDQWTGHGVDDRLYIAVRPARRGLAIALLIDISGSTDEWIDARRRVIDVEKVALLLASEALDALGDLYAILTFSGKGRANVRMRTIKGFDEANGTPVRRRIAALAPEGYTRAGAAIRHAAALLARQPAAHRLLLIISDGKPNDVDAYEGLSGVEDTRQSITEARRAGVYPFCLTIDRQGQDYLGRIFGEAGHTVLRNPQQLPMALVKVVKHLLAS